MVINTKVELLAAVARYYNTTAHPDRQFKLNIIADKIADKNYYYYRLWNEIVNHEWYHGFPDWAQVKDIFYNNQALENPALEDPNEKAEEPGRWVCKFCDGKEKETYTKIVNKIEYTFARDCGTCEGKGVSTIQENNVFKYYLGKKAYEDFICKVKILLEDNRKKVGVLST